MAFRAQVMLLPLVIAGLAVGCGKQPASTTAPDSGGAPAVADPAGGADPVEGDGGDDGGEIASDDGEASAGDLSTDESVREALLKLKLENGGTKIEHPGYMVKAGEEVTIIMKKGGHTHEIDFLFDNGAEGFDVKVEYRDNGRKVLSGDAAAASQAWFELTSGKAKLSMQLDPSAKRIDEVELTGGDQPLDDM